MVNSPLPPLLLPGDTLRMAEKGSGEQGENVGLEMGRKS